MIFSRYKKGQVSIEYIIGFSIVILLVVYVYFNMINDFPHYSNDINVKKTYQKVNYISSTIYSNSLLPNGTFNQSYLDFLNCGAYNYYDTTTIDSYKNVSDSLGLDLSESFQISGKIYYILIPSTKLGFDMYGKGIINNTEYDFLLKNNSLGRYNALSINGVQKNESELIEIDGHNYTIENVDFKGRYAILSDQDIFCGKLHNEETIFEESSIFGARKGGIEKLTILYWQ